MGKYFGTDGMRGKAEMFTAKFVENFVNSVIDEIKDKKDIYHLRFLIGGDTRKSTEFIIDNCLKTFNNKNVYCINAGIFPTPAISYITEKYDIDLSICVTASHNPSTDNGIKLFNENGEKVSIDFENAVEYRMDNNINSPDCNLNDLYITHLTKYINCDLSGLRIGLDCANGATSKVAGKIFKKLGADVITINDDSKYGHRINNMCGSTYIESIRDLVFKENLDFGASFDGDGDRCLFVDNDGNEIDGDHIIAITAKHLKDNGELKDDTIVTTIMANPGLLNFAADNNIKVEITDVGDSNVQSKMKENKLSLGGEQCGHIILPEQSTGDGILTALYISSLVKKYNKSLQELASIIIKYPQIIKNVPVNKNEKISFETSDKIKKLISRYEFIISENSGRLNVRPSGTQDYIRITMWGSNYDFIKKLSDDLADEISFILTVFYNGD